jgi:hypothetical protein
MSDDESAEIVSFEDASHLHLHARKEARLKKVKAAFRAATKEKFKQGKKKKTRKSGRRKKKK